MAIPKPNLDDHTFADLVEQAIAQIPVEYPEWTDHNPTDTGIILIELLAWLTEMTLYQVNQIPDKNYESFLQLLKGDEKYNLPKVSASENQKSLQSEIKTTLKELHYRYRAVTTEDYERLVLKDWNDDPENDVQIARVLCLPTSKLKKDEDAECNSKGHITLVVVPKNTGTKKEYESTNYDNLSAFLDKRKLLTTQLHITDPDYEKVKIEAKVILETGVNSDEFEKQANAEVQNFFAPLNSGNYWQGKGWPFGRSVYLSEIYKLFDDLEGIDYVEQIKLIDEGNNSLTKISLAKNQLVEYDLEESKITIKFKNGK